MVEAWWDDLFLFNEHVRLGFMVRYHSGAVVLCLKCCLVGSGWLEISDGGDGGCSCCVVAVVRFSMRIVFCLSRMMVVMASPAGRKNKDGENKVR